MDTLLKHIDPKTAEQARQRGHWKGTRSLNKTIWDDLKGNKKRIATSWIRSTLQIGAETVVETTNRGDQFVPAIVHWASDPHHLPYAYNGLIMFYPSASTIRAEAAENSLLIAYPNTTQEGTDIFTLGVANLPPHWIDEGHIVSGLEDLPCLHVNVTSPGLELLPITYGSQIQDHYIYNISYAVPEGFEGIPFVKLDFTYTCEVEEFR
jgi:hypothetical protein